jgi:hypothetical protein
MILFNPQIFNRLANKLSELPPVEKLTCNRNLQHIRNQQDTGRIRIPENL